MPVAIHTYILYSRESVLRGDRYRDLPARRREGFQPLSRPGGRHPSGFDWSGLPPFRPSAVSRWPTRWPAPPPTRAHQKTKGERHTKERQKQMRRWRRASSNTQINTEMYKTREDTWPIMNVQVAAANSSTGCRCNTRPALTQDWRSFNGPLHPHLRNATSAHKAENLAIHLPTLVVRGNNPSTGPRRGKTRGPSCLMTENRQNGARPVRWG